MRRPPGLASGRVCRPRAPHRVGLARKLHIPTTRELEFTIPTGFTIALPDIRNHRERLISKDPSPSPEATHTPGGPPLGRARSLHGEPAQRYRSLSNTFGVMCTIIEGPPRLDQVPFEVGSKVLGANADAARGKTDAAQPPGADLLF